MVLVCRHILSLGWGDDVVNLYFALCFFIHLVLLDTSSVISTKKYFDYRQWNLFIDSNYPFTIKFTITKYDNEKPLKMTNIWCQRSIYRAPLLHIPVNHSTQTTTTRPAGLETNNFHQLKIWIADNSRTGTSPRLPDMHWVDVSVRTRKILHRGYRSCYKLSKF